ncbi:MAG: DUF2269 family protein [Gemmatimonadales bacterium]|nr:DUF2269 family protein [Gemmatimonadales bacterium]
MGDYTLWKTLHVVGVVLMVGNVTVTGVWAGLLWRWRARLAFTDIARGILWTDLWFTFGGGTLLTIAGLMMVRVGRLDWAGTPWLRHGIEALALSTGVWLAMLLPDQFRMLRCRPDEGERFARLFRRWTVLGWTVTAPLYWALAWMVWKG